MQSEIFQRNDAVLYHNVGTPGRPRFEDVTTASGWAGAGARPGRDLRDFDGDGWPDIFIGNDGQPNRLWINQKNGTFKEEAVKRGVAYNGMGLAQAGMGVALGDADGDGLEDLFVTHFGEEANALWVQGPRGLFRDLTGAVGPAAPHCAAPASARSWPTSTWTAPSTSPSSMATSIGKCRCGDGGRRAVLVGLRGAQSVVHGDGKGRFRDLSPAQPALCGRSNVGRGLVVGDVDGDGAPDLLVTTVGGRARLLLNRAPNRGHWLAVRPLDSRRAETRSAPIVTVRAGGRSWLRRADPAGGYLCSGDRALFGLGSASVVEGIEVLWPDGSREAFVGGPADRAIELRKGQGRQRRTGGADEDSRSAEPRPADFAGPCRRRRRPVLGLSRSPAPPLSAEVPWSGADPAAPPALRPPRRRPP